MKGLAVERGVEVDANGRRYVITHVLDFDAVMAQEMATGKVERLAVVDLRPARGAAQDAPTPDLSVLDGKDWDEARRRQRVIRRLLEMPRRSREDVINAAEELNADRATIYRWLSAYRTTGKLSSLLPHKPPGGRGKSRLDDAVENIVKTIIEQAYLSKQQRSVRATADEVARVCKLNGLNPPHPNTVRSRILAISNEVRLRRRGHTKHANRLVPRPGVYDDAKVPLSVVQIDHTKLDIIVVDSVDRMPVGRPWITLAFDVYSRMVVGFYVSLDPPSASTTGLCLAHAILPKETWLAKRNISNAWPCWGFPAKIHLDNAKEFRGDMLRLACEEYGIGIDFRPIATPHFGAHIERMLGTLARALHELPGATFSNPSQRGDYDSDAKAVFTVDELECWIAEYVTGTYHKKLHTAIQQSPLKRWTDAILGTADKIGVGMAARPVDEDRLRLDFMPLVERTIQPYGVRIDDIHYYSDVLRPYISAKNGRAPRSFIFRRDPRDISAVYFWDPELKHYCTVPYRNITHPSINVWELREARRRLEESGKVDIDEDALFESLRRLREHEEQAALRTKVVRRNRERRTAVQRVPPPKATPRVAAAPRVEASTVIEAFEIDDV